MERHRLGARYGISAESISFFEVEDSNKSDVRQRLITLLSVDARICAHPERLCLRIQNCAVCYHKDLKLVCKQPEGMWICDHLKHGLCSPIEYEVICGAYALEMLKV